MHQFYLQSFNDSSNHWNYAGFETTNKNEAEKYLKTMDWVEAGIGWRIIEENNKKKLYIGTSSYDKSNNYKFSVKWKKYEI